MSENSKSKYSKRPEVNEQMVEDVIMWVEESLVEHIPVMTAYTAFAVKLLDIAVESTGLSSLRSVKEDHVRRATDFIARSSVMDTPQLLSDPDFVRSLLLTAFNSTSLRAVGSNEAQSANDRQEDEADTSEMD